jgi:hypothetical protein
MLTSVTRCVAGLGSRIVRGSSVVLSDAARSVYETTALPGSALRAASAASLSPNFRSSLIEGTTSISDAGINVGSTAETYGSRPLTTKRDCTTRLGSRSAGPSGPDVIGGLERHDGHRGGGAERVADVDERLAVARGGRPQVDGVHAPGSPFASGAERHSWLSSSPACAAENTTPGASRSDPISAATSAPPSNSTSRLTSAAAWPRARCTAWSAR